MTTDEVTHLRALLAEQTARAEGLEAEADHLNRLVLKARTERDAALAACAEMRAACAPLLEWLTATLPGAERLGSPGAIVGPGQVRGRDVGLTVMQARVLFDVLSRTDLGRGWASPEVVERARFILRRDGTSEDCKRVVADLDALLDDKKGGG